MGGWALYKLYRTRWWDYTDKPFNIGGYVCLEFSLMWGVGAMVVVKVIHPAHCRAGRHDSAPAGGLCTVCVCSTRCTPPTWWPLLSLPAGLTRSWTLWKRWPTVCTP
ncbi:MAG: putative ABC transporter permease [Faecalibacterium prausnitzii]